MTTETLRESIVDTLTSNNNGGITAKSLETLLLGMTDVMDNISNGTINDNITIEEIYCDFIEGNGLELTQTEHNKYVYDKVATAFSENRALPMICVDMAYPILGVSNSNGARLMYYANSVEFINPNKSDLVQATGYSGLVVKVIYNNVCYEFNVNHTGKCVHYVTPIVKK